MSVHRTFLFAPGNHPNSPRSRLYFAMSINFLNELEWRGLVHQCTNEGALRAHLDSGTRRAYVGFDPTADSLTIGNMVTMMLLVHFQRAGHEPVVVMGGGTGLIGDPSGKSAERQFMTAQMVRDNVEAQRPIFERLWSNAGMKPPQIVNRMMSVEETLLAVPYMPSRVMYM